MRGILPRRDARWCRGYRPASTAMLNRVAATGATATSALRDVRRIRAGTAGRTPEVPGGLHGDVRECVAHPAIRVRRRDRRAVAGTVRLCVMTVGPSSSSTATPQVRLPSTALRRTSTPSERWIRRPIPLPTIALPVIVAVDRKTSSPMVLRTIALPDTRYPCPDDLDPDVAVADDVPRDHVVVPRCRESESALP